MKAYAASVWKRPRGVVFEFAKFENGTRGIAQAVADGAGLPASPDGGDTLAAIAVPHWPAGGLQTSAGGGAFLEVLEGKRPCPPFEVLARRAGLMTMKPGPCRVGMAPKASHWCEVQIALFAAEVFPPQRAFQSGSIFSATVRITALSSLDCGRALLTKLELVLRLAARCLHRAGQVVGPSAVTPWPTSHGHWARR